MTVALLSLVLGIGLTPPDAAFVARVYLPGKTKSHYHVYLWKGPGATTEQLSRDGVECSGVTWRNRDSLRWHEYDQRGRSAVEYSLATKTRRVLGTEVVEDFFEQASEEYDPEVASRSVLDFDQRVTLQSGNRGIGYEEVDRDGHPSRAYIIAKDQPPVFMDGGDEETTVFNRGGKEFRLSVDASNPEFLPGRHEDEAVYSSGEFAVSAGSTGRIWLIDWSKGSVTKIIDGPERVHLDLENGWWWGIMGDRESGPIEGGRREWDVKGKVGNWMSGDEWVLVEKTSVVREIAFRPTQ
jgi:hypothetical protein